MHKVALGNCAEPLLFERKGNGKRHTHPSFARMGHPRSGGSFARLRACVLGLAGDLSLCVGRLCAQGELAELAHASRAKDGASRQIIS
jgi:hypothetical protein